LWSRFFAHRCSLWRDSLKKYFSAFFNGEYMDQYVHAGDRNGRKDAHAHDDDDGHDTQ
jgi:hypothetical protein